MDEPTDATPYVAGSPLVRLFESPGRTRIVEAFLGKCGAEVTGAEVAKLAGVDRSTVSRNIDVLLELGLVEYREVSPADLYRIDADAPVVQNLVAARRALLRSMAETEPSDMGTDRDSVAEVYVEHSGLVRLFGTPGRTKMVEVFLGKRGAELTATEVAKLAGIDKSTVSRNIGALVQFCLVEETRTVGNSVLYRLDRDNRVSEALGNARYELFSDLETLNRATTRNHARTDRSHTIDGTEPDSQLFEESVTADLVVDVPRDTADDLSAGVRAVLTRIDAVETVEEVEVVGIDPGLNSFRVTVTAQLVLDLEQLNPETVREALDEEHGVQTEVVTTPSQSA